MQDAKSIETDFSDISLETFGSHLLFGDIDNDSIKDAVEFIVKANNLKMPAEVLTLYINSPGGTMTDGFGLIDIMQLSRLPIRTFGLGVIASMGVYIICAGSKGKRSMSRNTEVMAHQFSAGFEGKHHELVSINRAMQYAEALTIRHFLKFSNMDEKQIKDILFSPTDRFLTPAECKKLGLIDTIVDELPEDMDLVNFFSQPTAKPRRRPAIKK